MTLSVLNQFQNKTTFVVYETLLMLLLQVSKLRCQIDDEMQRNKKLKENVVALQEEVDKSVSQVTMHQKDIHFLMYFLTYSIEIKPSAYMLLFFVVHRKQTEKEKFPAWRNNSIQSKLLSSVSVMKILSMIRS